MNPIHRKAKTVEMTNSTDHRDVSGGLGRRLRRPRLIPYVALVAVVAAIPVAAGSAAGPSLPKPGGLKTFQLRLSDSPEASANGSCGRSPARQHSRGRPFAVPPATSSSFRRARTSALTTGVIWSSKNLDDASGVRADLTSVDHRAPASFHWRVRATHGSAVSAWSTPVSSHGLGSVLTGRGHSPVAAERAGFVRWSKVSGASGYQVWFMNLSTPSGPSRRSRMSPTSVSFTAEIRPRHARGVARPIVATGLRSSHRTAFRHSSTGSGAAPIRLKCRQVRIGLTSDQRPVTRSLM